MQKISKTALILKLRLQIKTNSGNSFTRGW